MEEWFMRALMIGISVLVGCRAQGVGPAPAALEVKGEEWACVESEDLPVGQIVVDTDHLTLGAG